MSLLTHEELTDHDVIIVELEAVHEATIVITDEAVVAVVVQVLIELLATELLQ